MVKVVVKKNKKGFFSVFDPITCLVIFTVALYLWAYSHFDDAYDRQSNNEDARRAQALRAGKMIQQKEKVDHTLHDIVDGHHHVIAKVPDSFTEEGGFGFGADNDDGPAHVKMPEGEDPGVAIEDNY